MSDQNQTTPQDDSDNGMADAIAATAVITLVIATVVYWLSGFPS